MESLDTDLLIERHHIFAATSGKSHSIGCRFRLCAASAVCSGPASPTSLTRRVGRGAGARAARALAPPGAPARLRVRGHPGFEPATFWIDFADTSSKGIKRRYSLQNYLIYSIYTSDNESYPTRHGQEHDRHYRRLMARACTPHAAPRAAPPIAATHHQQPEARSFGTLHQTKTVTSPCAAASIGPSALHWKSGTTVQRATAGVRFLP